MGAAKVTKGIGVRRAWLGCLAGLFNLVRNTHFSSRKPENRCRLNDHIHAADEQFFYISFEYIISGQKLHLQ